MDGQIDLTHLTYVETLCWPEEESIGQPQRVLRDRENAAQAAYQIAGPRSIGLDAAERKRSGVVNASGRQSQVSQDRGRGCWY